MRDRCGRSCSPWESRCSLGPRVGIGPSQTAVRSGLASILGTGLTLTILGLAGTAVWSSFVLSRAFAGRVPSVAALLGMRRLEADPSSVGRVVGGVAILIALLGIGQAGYLAADLEAGGESSSPAWVRGLDPATVLIVLDQPRDHRLLPGLAELQGVNSVDLVKRLPTGGYRTKPSTAIIETDGRRETIQALRDEIGWYGSVGTLAETFDRSGEISRDRRDPSGDVLAERLPAPGDGRHDAGCHRRLGDGAASGTGGAYGRSECLPG